MRLRGNLDSIHVTRNDFINARVFTPPRQDTLEAAADNNQGFVS
jgi:hypothetical protein